MKIFLGWSGELSRRSAEAFHGWIPNVLQTVEPFMSEEDIAIGSRWSRHLDQELDESDFGVMFVTPDNYEKPWLLFEAGALSKSIADARVSPLLIGVSRTELTGPLTHFQSALPERSDMRRLVGSINEACGETGLEDDRVDRVFNTWWGELEPLLAALVKEAEKAEAAAPHAERRPDSEIIAETLEVVRSLQRAVSDPSIMLPPDYLDHILGRLQRGRGPDRLPSALLEDLEVAWARFSSVIEHRSDESEWAGELEHAYRRLAMPMTHLLHAFPHRPSRKRPSAPSE